MKKGLMGAALFFLPIMCCAQTVGFTNNLYYGLTNNTDVSQWQEFLTTQGFYVPDTGNFFSLTLKATKEFQSAETISPVSGFVGPITRATANAILAEEVSQSEENAATTSEPVDLATTTPTYIPPTYTPPVYVPSTQSFGGVESTTTPFPPPTCTLIGTTTPYGASEDSGTIDWNTQNATTITLTGINLPHVLDGTATYQLTPVSEGETNSLPVSLNGSNFTATVNGEGGTATCALTLP